MKVLNLILSVIWMTAAVVHGQATQYCDPATSICYSSYTSDYYSMTFRLALPNVTKAPFDLILQVVAPIDQQWVGFSFKGHMIYSPLIVGWPNGNNVVYSSRWATGYTVPGAYAGATYTTLKGTGVNATHWTYTVRCRGCSTWVGSDGVTESLDPTGSQLFAWAQSFEPVITPSSNTTLFNVHDSHDTWTHDLSSARSSNFDTWVANNGGGSPSSTSSTTVPPSTSTTSTSTTIPSTTPPSSTSTSTSSCVNAAVPTSCPGVAAQRYPSQITSGWRAAKVAGSLTTPRGIIFDNAGHLLVVESGKGITAHTLSSNGCIASSKTLIAQTNLNHGIYLTPDGKTLYASSSTSVWRWTYNSGAVSVGSSTVVVMGMSNSGHVTRTLAIPKSKPNLLVVQVGSNDNLDMAAGNMATGRACVKVFDMSSVPSGGYNYVTGGWQAGYGLRNEVALVIDPSDNLWGLENSSDDMARNVNGVSKDIHVDNPAEELNYLGDVSVPNTKWYGYPTCFTVWSPSAVTDKSFAIGDQIVQAPNTSFNDASCVGKSTPPRLSMQAHSAPLGAQFDAQGANLYAGFHGSWDRPTPTGFKVVRIPFTRGSDGLFAPVAAANSASGYTDVFWNTNTNACSFTNCFRPVAIAFDNAGRMYITSDAPGEGEMFVLGSTAASVCSTSTSTSTTITTTPSTTKTTSTTPSPTTSAGPTQTHYGQCGGQGWTGPTVCASPYTCQFSNNWYSQCL